ncbi:28S ribosomal protein S25, mitochondrial [Willisornis vidua]|uniref:Small ribosomal subunit protein mS25 n=1 Tax=Willisornis vidua TaxID=1566151 RepID=A0ABQ9DF32_9PASS|nr:28S ribosomal protein S25, mitochondrial [Willisornis vidua]
MKGRFAVRRTLRYLSQGDLVFKSAVKVMTVNYNSAGEMSEGARKFVFFNIPQIQYKNPWVQIMLFRNMTPSPFLRFYLGLDDEGAVVRDKSSQFLEMGKKQVHPIETTLPHEFRSYNSNEK